MTYDAVIVGSGACGGWAAMALCQAGMKVLLLEAGSRIDPVKDFKHVFLYEMDYRGQGKPGLMRRYAGSERKVIEYYQRTPEALAQIRAPLYEEKVVDYILDQAKVSERKVPLTEVTSDDLPAKS